MNVQNGTCRPQTVHTSFGPTPVDLLVSKYEAMHGGQSVWYSIHEVSEEALQAMQMFSQVHDEARALVHGCPGTSPMALSSEELHGHPTEAMMIPGNQLWTIFASKGRSIQLLIYSRHLDEKKTPNPNGQLDGMRVGVSNCGSISDAVFSTLCDLYSNSGTPGCSGVYQLLFEEDDHVACAVQTSSGEWVVHDHWVPAYEPHLLQHDRFYARLKDPSQLKILKYWQPGMQVDMDMRRLLEAACEAGPLAENERPFERMDQMFRLGGGLDGVGRLMLSNGFRLYSEDESTLTPDQVAGMKIPVGCNAHGAPVVQRVAVNERFVYRSPSGATFNGDLFCPEKIGYLMDVKSDMEREDFPQAHIAEAQKYQIHLASRAAESAGLAANTLEGVAPNVSEAALLEALQASTDAGLLDGPAERRDGLEDMHGASSQDQR